MPPATAAFDGLAVLQRSANISRLRAVQEADLVDLLRREVDDVLKLLPGPAVAAGGVDPRSLAVVVIVCGGGDDAALARGSPRVAVTA